MELNYFGCLIGVLRERIADLEESKLLPVQFIFLSNNSALTNKINVQRTTGEMVANRLLITHISFKYRTNPCFKILESVKLF